MIAFAFLDSDGNPTGGGMKRHLPDGAVALTAPFGTKDLPRLRHRDGRWEERDDLPRAAPPTPEARAAADAALLDKARVEAAAAINRRAGAVRARIHTAIPGQDALYLEKRAEARAYVAAAREGGDPADLGDFPLLAGETGITAPDPWQLAQLWLNRAAQFARVGAATEALRMRALAAAATAPDFAALESIESDLAEALSSLPL